MRVVVLGTGYVGLTTGLSLGYVGHDVTCLDVDANKVARLRKGIPPIHEPGLTELMAAVSKRVHYTTEGDEAIAKADFVIIAVGTPPLPDGNPDLKYLRAAGEQIGKNIASPFTVVVNKSTVPVGSAHWVESIVRDAQEPTGSSAKFAVASNPEFLREGSAIHDSLYPDRIVVGTDNQTALHMLQELYQPVVNQSFPSPAFAPRPENYRAVPLVTASLTSAELIKYAANAFLSVKISFVNEIAALSEKVGGDITQVARGIGLDSRIGNRFLQAGLGWGGSCFGKDTSALIATGREYGVCMRIVQSARDVNYAQRDRVVEKLLGSLKILKGKTIGILGLAFKPNTDDLRDSPALDIAARLMERGAKVRAHDPIALENAKAQGAASGVVFSDSVEALVENADALVLATEWEEYYTLPWTDLGSKMRSKVMVDGRNFLNRAALEQAGFEYYGMGV